MQPGIIIEGITREEFFSEIITLKGEIEELKKLIANNTLPFITLSELARIKGYGKRQMRRILDEKHIPITYEGKELVISREDAGRLKAKAKYAHS